MMQLFQSCLYSGPLTQRSRFAPTLGCMIQSRWDCEIASEVSAKGIFGFIAKNDLGDLCISLKKTLCIAVPQADAPTLQKLSRFNRNPALVHFSIFGDSNPLRNFERDSAILKGLHRIAQC